MFHEIDDKIFLSGMRQLCGSIVQDTCGFLKRDFDIGAVPYLVGSGARNLIMQNGNEPVDLDYNIEIVRCEDFNNCRYLKECTRKAFNSALITKRQNNCEDSTSSLTSKKIHFSSGNRTPFSIDICIVTKGDNGRIYRLIHEKTGFVAQDSYFWNQAPNSKNIKKKADYIKAHGKWILVRNQYLNIKNKYLTSNDHDHPSFICYIEAVNNVFNSRNSW